MAEKLDEIHSHIEGGQVGVNAGYTRISQPHLLDGTKTNGWWYPQPNRKSTVLYPSVGAHDAPCGTTGVKSQGNDYGEWFYCETIRSTGW